MAALGTPNATKQSSNQPHSVSYQSSKAVINQSSKDTAKSAGSLSKDEEELLSELVQKMDVLAKSSNIEDAMTCGGGRLLYPCVMRNFGRIIPTKSQIAASIQSSKCLLSAFSDICDMLASYVSDDAKFSTEHLLSLLCHPSNKQDDIVQDFEYLKEELLEKEMIDWIDGFREEMTLQNVKKIWEIEAFLSMNEDEELTGHPPVFVCWDFVEFMHQHFSDCSIIMVPKGLYIEDAVEENDMAEQHHATFIVGRTTHGHLLAFTSYYEIV